MNTWMRSRIKCVIGLIALLSFLLITVSNFQGLVLCFEKDGQVSLENAIDGICSDAFQAIQRIQQQSFGSDETNLQASHCKRCVDVPITIESREHQDHKLQTFQGPIEVAALTEPPVISIGYLATVTEPQMPHPPPLRPTIHQYLSTIILLI